MTDTPRARWRLDLTSVGGVPIGLGLILVGQLLEGGTLHSILQFAASCIVFGGTLGAVLLSFSMADVWRASRSLRSVFFESGTPTRQTIATLVAFAIRARKSGIVSLDDDVSGIDDPFLRKGMMLAVDGVSPGTVREVLQIDSNGIEERDLSAASVFESAGGYAPTFGILGAVLGLIHVMENLSDPERLGAGIAVAFVATLYGVGAANLIFLPIATKLKRRAAQAAKERELIMTGVLAIQEGLNPRLIDTKLGSFIEAEDLVVDETGELAA